MFMRSTRLNSVMWSGRVSYGRHKYEHHNNKYVHVLDMMTRSNLFGAFYTTLVHRLKSFVSQWDMRRPRVCLRSSWVTHKITIPDEYGMTGLRVDGNCLLAVHEATKVQHRNSRQYYIFHTKKTSQYSKINSHQDHNTPQKRHKSTSGC